MTRVPGRLAIAIALLLAVGSVPALAGQKAPEPVQGGLTKDDRIANMRAIHAEVSAGLPRGHDATPIYVDLTDADRDAVDNPGTTGRVPLRIGIVKRISEVVGKPIGADDFQRGVLEDRTGGKFVWAATITSPGAQAIRLHIEDFSVPGNTELYVLGDNGQADGPYVARGRNGNGDFWSRTIVGETATVMLTYKGNRPHINKGRTAFRVSEIAHVRGRPTVDLRNHDSWPCSDNASCLVDAQCGGTNNAVNDAKAGVAKLEWITGQFVNTCTGGLIADTDTGSQIPLMLSANHCFSSSISNLETWFNYTTGSCNGACPDGLVTGGTPPPSDTVGMTVDATNNSSDYTIFTLSQAPPVGAVFMGWNNTPVANINGTNLYRISNANFGPQVYSEHQVDTGSPTCSGIPRGAWIYSQDQLGATMGGSSGSPVVNSSGQIVGQLTGCCGFNCGNVCDSNNNWTIDGALADYFAEVEDILDPQGGCSTNADCPDDGLFCNGTEFCDAGTCGSTGDPCNAGETCNEATDTCDLPACDGDGACEPGEDCNNCPSDCRSKVNGNPSSRYCCDGDLPDCGDSRCSESGFSCGQPQGCSTNADCPDDSVFCNGTEFCNAGTCDSTGDPCGQGESCDEGSGTCVTCGGNKAPCSSNSDCCSNNCKNGACKGN